MTSPPGIGMLPNFALINPNCSLESASVYCLIHCFPIELILEYVKFPKGILDIKHNQSIGSIKLKEYVEIKKPKYHLFGHAHHLKGIYSNGGTVFINNSIVYNAPLRNVINKPIDIMIDND